MFTLSLPWTDFYKIYIIEKMIIDNTQNIIPDTVISAQNHRDNDYIYHCLDNAVLRIDMCYNIRAYDICSIIAKYFATPIYNITPCHTLYSSFRLLLPWEL